MIVSSPGFLYILFAVWETRIKLTTWLKTHNSCLAKRDGDEISSEPARLISTSERTPDTSSYNNGYIFLILIMFQGLEQLQTNSLVLQKLNRSVKKMPASVNKVLEFRFVCVEKKFKKIQLVECE